MLTDYEPDPVVACSHRWRFRCWYRDIGSGEDASLRWMLEVCRRCAGVRITHYAGCHKLNGYGYAKNVMEALLGSPYALPRLAGVLQN